MTLAHKHQFRQSYAELLEDNMALRREGRKMARHIEAVESELRIYREIARQHPEIFGRRVERADGSVEWMTEREFQQAIRERAALRNTVKALESKLQDRERYIQQLERQVERQARRTG